MSRFNEERLMTILRAPTISEKATWVADKHNQVVFEVLHDATKPEIKAAVELMFKVQVNDVNVVNVRGKHKRFGRYIGKRRSWKNVFPGKRMAGHLGNVRRTVQRLQIVRVDTERSLLMIKGSVPGSKGGNVIVRPSVKAGG